MREVAYVTKNMLFIFRKLFPQLLRMLFKSATEYLNLNIASQLSQKRRSIFSESYIQKNKRDVRHFLNIFKST